MRPSYVGRQALVGLGVAAALGLLSTPMAAADPEPFPPMPAPAPAADAPVDPGPMPVADPAALPIDPADAAHEACSKFAVVLDFSSQNYVDFANELALGNQYSDPSVATANVTGRVGLRQSAVTAMSAANTPGLAPEISAPMRAWSGDATKLWAAMAVRAPVDTINKLATELNDDGTNAQMACANAGTHA